MARCTTILLLLLSFSSPTFANADLEGNYLYKVSTLRASLGQFEALLQWIEDAKESGFYRDEGGHAPLIMRHSQGDQWDLLVISPMQSWDHYYSPEAIGKRAQAVRKHSELVKRIGPLIAFHEDLFAYGPGVEALQKAHAEHALFHIEMFAAAPGKAAELRQQRRMENDYLTATGQTANMIFTRAAGSDIDVFTIGFHKDLAAFAAPAKVSDDAKEAAAKEAGFKDRADLSFYLRSLISSHHDTLAGPVN